MRLTRRSLLGALGAASLLPEWTAARAAAHAPHSSSTELRMVLALGPTQAGAGNHRWAGISGGWVEGGGSPGQVRAGRLDWHVDPASGAVEAAATVTVSCGDGRVAELRRGNLAAVRLEDGLVRLSAI